MSTEKDSEKGISELVGVFTDPIIAWPGGWMDTIPKRAKEAITLERLVMCMKVARGELPTGTNAEALAYIYPRTMEAPMDRVWVDIYVWLGGQVFPESFKDTDIEVKELTREQMQDLNRLKAWIYQKRIGARLDRSRAERQAKRAVKVAELAAVAATQLDLFR